MIKINYTVSLGSFCHTATFLKNNGFKKESYPFDWIVTTPELILNILNDNFKLLLDKSQFIPVNNNICGHKIYGKQFFLHFNLLNGGTYEYYKRCVQRFATLLKKEEPKLFILTLINSKNIINNKQRFYKINKKLKELSNNYYILIINCVYKPDRSTIFNLTKEGNIFFIDFFTLGDNQGDGFASMDDTNNYKKIILEFFDIDTFKLV
jgi:hypothetical protein